MTIRSALVAVATVAALAGPAAATTWDIDPAHTSIQFAIRHMMVSSVHGQFTKVVGTVQTSDKDLSRSIVQASIDASSIDTHEPKRDEHLKSPDFFDVAQFPTITFVSKKIQPAGKGHWKVTGDLTMHGVTKPVVLDVEASGASVKDPMGKTRAGAHATTKINRKDFGIVWNKALDGGGIAVGDQVDVTIDVEGVQQAAATGG